MDKSKVLIVEDEKQLSRFLELELQHEGYLVDIVADGREALKKLEKDSYSLILLDIMLPGLNGMEVCRRIRQSSDIPIIILTAKDDIIDKVMGLDLGADDYITKPFAIEELLARIRVALRRERHDKTIQNSILRVGELVLDTSKYQVTQNGAVIEVTKKEYDLLKYLVCNAGIVLSREQILEAVWGYDYLGDSNIVDVYIRYLRSKIDDDSQTKLICTVRGVGYVLKGNKG